MDTLTARQLRDRIAAGDLDPREVVDRSLARIQARNGTLNAFLHVDEEGARRASEAIRDRVARGDVGSALLGVPVALKDNLCRSRGPTTAGSRILEGYRAPYDAAVVERIVEEGGVIVGKTNMDEFGMGSSSEYSAFGPVRNPLDLDRTPGGSSGGSAAAVADGMVWLATGSDTGGSIRQPAASCGLVGLKPTYGRVSRYGLVAYASSLDQVGPLARDAGDAALMMNVLSGWDRRDASSSREPVPDHLGGLEDGVSGLRFGLPREFFAPGLDPEVEARVREEAGRLEEAGAEVRECSLPHTPWAVAAYYVVATAEASANLARYDGVRYGRRARAGDLASVYSRSRSEGFGMEVKRRILLGSFVLSAGYAQAYYGKALRVRRMIREDFRRVFREGFDAILGPTTPAPPFRLGEKLADPLLMYLFDAYTVSVNLAGLPAVSVPAGRTASGLPVGLQIIGDRFREPELLRIARALEKS